VMDGRRFSKAALGGVLCLFLALQVRCDGGPSETIVLEVGGAWVEISTLVNDGCGFDDPPLPATITSNLTVVPSGDQISFVYPAQGGGSSVLTGTWNSRTGVFSLTFVDQIDDVTLTAVVNGTFTSNSRYTSETSIVISDGVVSCTVLTSEVGQRSS
jgi:hypothetical protein